MRIVSTQVTNFKSIADSGVVTIDPNVTVFVGQNEAGKSAFLQALYKSRPADNSGAQYSKEMDYPRAFLNDYEERHPDSPAVAVNIVYEIDASEIDAVNAEIGARVLRNSRFSVSHTFDNSVVISLGGEEKVFAEHILNTLGMSEEIITKCQGVDSVRGIINKLNDTSPRSPEEEAFLGRLNTRFGKMGKSWSGADHEIWKKHLEPLLPRFVYFDDYRLLPGRMNLASLKSRVQQHAQGEKAALKGEDHAVLGLLRMAKVDLDELLASTTYESIVAKLEAFSNKVTDRVFKYWQQNDQLEVRIDVRATPGEQLPFNNGPNLEIRIFNKRHRVTVSFDQRSRGFIWFFSFLVWFDSVKQQLGTDKGVALLLDEPGLNLHALAQSDFLRYIDDLAKKHQTLYTTHSPFMVHSDRLNQVRLVEDRKDIGTTVTDDVTGSDPKTVFPLQAALGYTIAQNLFISKRNLLVEGPTDLIFLQQMSAALEALGRTGLRQDVTIVPTGGLDNVATFIALLGGNQLESVVMHDFGGAPHQRIQHLQREKIVHEKHVMNFGMFRAPAGSVAKKKSSDTSGDGSVPPSTDIEDLFEVSEYLIWFNAAYSQKLGAVKIQASDLPEGARIVERIGRCLKEKGIVLREPGGFNHYLPASYLASHPPKKFENATLDRFQALFEAVNGGFTKPD